MTHNDSDDVESEVRIADGAKAMPKAWMEVLGESYYRPDVSSVAGIKHKVDAIDYDSVMSVLGHDQGHGQCRSDSKDTTKDAAPYCISVCRNVTEVKKTAAYRTSVCRNVIDASAKQR